MGLRELTGVDCRDASMPTYAASHCSLLIHRCHCHGARRICPFRGCAHPMGTVRGGCYIGRLELKINGIRRRICSRCTLGKLTVDWLMGTPPYAYVFGTREEVVAPGRKSASPARSCCRQNRLLLTDRRRATSLRTRRCCGQFSILRFMINKWGKQRMSTVRTRSQLPAFMRADRTLKGLIATVRLEHCLDTETNLQELVAANRTSTSGKTAYHIET